MKSLKFTIITATVIILFSSCTKEHTPATLNGKWQIQQLYYGYGNGGDFQWHVIPDEGRHVIEFEQDSIYTETYPVNNSASNCSGSYKVITDHLISINKGSQVTPYNVPVDITSESLTFTYTVREGQVKEKYIRVQ